jgi:glycine cleavage system transcriptional repressor
MPSKSVIFIATGPDRPGVMDEVSQFILERGGTVSDSRSTNLRGQFALLVLVSGDEPAIAKITKDIDSLANPNGFHAHIQPAGGSARTVDTFPYRFTARGANQANAIQRISHLFRVLNINIEGLDTKVGAAAKAGAGGDVPFEMKLSLVVPRETPIVMLRDYLTQLCQEMNIAFELTAA